MHMHMQERGGPPEQVTAEGDGAGLCSVTFWRNTYLLELKGRARPCLAVEVAGVLAAAAPLGMASGKVGHHPGWKPLQGFAGDRIPGWAPSPCRLPGPVTRYETCLRLVF